MTVRKPLVINAGKIQQLQSGDTLSTQSSEQEIITLTNDEAMDAIVIGMPVYIDAADGCKMAKADAAATAVVCALCNTASVETGATGTFVTDGVCVATTGQWDAVAGTTGGLVAGSTYYLSAATAGNITSTATETDTQLVVEVGVEVCVLLLK